MIRVILRRLKHFVLRHAGVARLLENDAQLAQELAGVRELLQRHAGTLQRLDELRPLLEVQQHALCRPEHLRALEESQSQALTQLEELAQLRDGQTHLARQFERLRPLLEGQGLILLRLHAVQALLDEYAGPRLESLHVRLDEHANALARVEGEGQAVRQLAEALTHTLAELREGLEDSAGSARQLLEAQHAALRGEMETLPARLAQAGALHERLHQLEQGVARVAAVSAEVQAWGLDRWKLQECEGLMRGLRRTQYETAVREGRLERPVVETAHPIAVHSDDTRFPWGAKNDNSICLKFNAKLYQLFPPGKRLAVLDLGCAGGGFVRSLIDDGHLAVGLDGCDYPKVHGLGEWRTIPHHLHNCDLTQPFSVLDARSGALLRFDVITAWEVLEHIRDEDLSVFFRNVHNHLACGGLFLCSVSTVEDGNPELGAVYHVTVRPRDWWLDRLAELGFEVVEQQIITKDDWLRGSGNCRLDTRCEDEGTGFHLALRRRQRQLLAA